MAAPPATPRQHRWDIVVGLLLAAGAVLSTILSRSMDLDDAHLRPQPGEEYAWRSPSPCRCVFAAVTRWPSWSPARSPSSGCRPGSWGRTTLRAAWSSSRS